MNEVDFKKFRLVILWSGGLDTTIAYWYAKSKGYSDDEILMLYINLGHPYAWKELKAIDWFRRNRLIGAEIRVMNVDLINERYGNVPTIDKQVIGGRNLLLLWYGSYFVEGGGEVWVGFLDGEMHKYMRDKNGYFLVETESLMNYVFDKEFLIVAPFRNMTKADIVRWLIGYLGRKKAEEIINHTYTCYSENELACGKCTACFKRWIAYELNDLDWRIYWDSAPYESEEAEKLIERYKEAVRKGDFSHYSERRICETVKALKKVGKDVSWAKGVCEDD